MILSTFESLKNRGSFINNPGSTMDLVNGLFVTINSTIKDFDYATSYELLPEIVSVFYKCLGIKPLSLKPKISAPTCKDIDFISIAGQLLGIGSIGLNRTREKTHIHFWFYNLHSFNLDYQHFNRDLIRNLGHLKGISKRNEFSVKLIPCIDAIDKDLRKSDYNNQAIVDYISNREHGTLMNYFATKNDKNFIYFY